MGMYLSTKILRESKMLQVCMFDSYLMLLLSVCFSYRGHQSKVHKWLPGSLSLVWVFLLASYQYHTHFTPSLKKHSLCTVIDFKVPNGYKHPSLWKVELFVHKQACMIRVS
jgi:hypothetical protein